MSAKVTRCMLEAFNTNSANDLSEQISLLEKYRIRLCHSTLLPIWSNSSAPASDIILIDLLSHEKKEEQSEECRYTDNVRSRPFEYEMDVDEANGGCPLTFQFLTLASMKSNETWKAPRRTVGSVSIEYFNCNPIPTREALELRDIFVSNDYLETTLSGLPVVFITDGSDKEVIALASMQLCKNKINSSLTRFFGRATDSVKQQLCQLTKRFGALEKRSKASAVYSIVSEKASGIAASAAVMAKMNLTFKWQEGIKDNTFLAPPSPSASAILHVSPGWKDVRISLYENSKELEFILALAKTLSDDTTMMFPKSEKRPEEILKKVSDLVDSCRGIQRDTASQNNRFFDFTEHLWSCIKDCDSYETLVSAFKIVFGALKELKINTILHHDNKSTVARLVRDSLSGELLLPRLEALTPIQLLLEIGIERFRRDMVHMFVSESLATSEKEIMDAKFVGTNPEQRAYSLLPMHLALQTMLEIKKNLQISTHQIVNMTRIVLHQFSDAPITDISKVFFETEVSFVDIKPEIMENVQPLLWTNETLYMHKNPIASTVVSFSRESNFKHLDRFIHTKSKDCDEPADPSEQYLCSLTTSTFVNRDILP